MTRSGFLLRTRCRSSCAVFFAATRSAWHPLWMSVTAIIDYDGWEGMKAVQAVQVVQAKNNLVEPA